MTKAEYEAKYGAKPAVSAGPVQMTRAQYEAKYGAATTEEPGFLKSVAADIAKPFARLGLNAQAIGMTLGGDKEGVQKLLTEGRPTWMGTIKPVGAEGMDPTGKVTDNKKYWSDTIGTGLDVGSYAIMAPEVKGALSLTKAITKPVLKRLAAEGALQGGTWGLGRSMQEDGFDLKKNLMSAGVNALTGGIFAPIAGTAFAMGGRTLRAGGGVAESAYRKLVPTQEMVTANIDKLVGTITQGTKHEISKAKQALRLIDTSAVKTYEELRELTTKGITALAQKQDQLLTDHGITHAIGDLTQKIKVGSKEVAQNFVTDAVGQLKEFYKTSMDLENLARIGDLEERMMSGGITTKEINDLAREYGSQFAEKAFDKLGQPLTSVGKLAMENTRKGLKALARKYMPNKQSQALDAGMSNLYTLQRTAQKMEDKVQQLSNRVKERGLLEKIARHAGRGIDLLTGHAARGLLTSFIPSNVGNKVMNSLDLEAILRKNLKRVTKLLDEGTDDEIVNFLTETLKDAKPRSLTD